MSRYTLKRFLSKTSQEWRKLTEDNYYEAEDLIKTSKDFASGILERDIIKRIELLNNVNNKVIEQSKVEMKYHLDRHNLYKQIIEDYENV